MERNRWIWWIVAIVLLGTATPLGVILLLWLIASGNKEKKQKALPRHAGDKTVIVNTGEAVSDAIRTAGGAVDDALRSVSEAVDGALNGRRPTSTKSAPAQSAQSTKTYAPSHRVKRPLKRLPGQLATWLGGIFAGIFALGAVIEFFECLSELWYGVFDYADLLAEVVPLGVFAAIGAGVALWGLQRQDKVRRVERYLRLIPAGRDSLSVQALADALDLKPARVYKDLDEMIDRGYFPFAYLDRGQGKLILSPDYVALYDQANIKSEAKAEPAAASTAESDDNALLRRIRAANDLIDDEAISARLDDIETLTRKIFQTVEQQPEKAEALHRFNAYYLPQTLKLAEAYARLEAQGVEGENITQAKDKIADALDRLVGVYRQQLDQLFAADVVDITADIAVMEQMLARDGLAGEELQPERRS